VSIKPLYVELLSDNENDAEAARRLLLLLLLLGCSDDDDDVESLTL